MLRFRQFLLESEEGYNEPYDNERPLLRKLFRMSLEDQIDADQSLHRSAIGKNTFGASGSNLLAKDHDDKNLVRGVLLGQNNSPESKSQAINTLRKDMANHARYLSMPPSETTGSHPWHQAWKEVYKDWLTRLAIGRGSSGIVNHSTVWSGETP